MSPSTYMYTCTCTYVHEPYFLLSTLIPNKRQQKGVTYMYTVHVQSTCQAHLFNTLTGAHQAMAARKYHKKHFKLDAGK